MHGKMLFYKLFLLSKEYYLLYLMFSLLNFVIGYIYNHIFVNLPFCIQRLALAFQNDTLNADRLLMCSHYRLHSNNKIQIYIIIILAVLGFFKWCTTNESSLWFCNLSN